MLGSRPSVAKATVCESASESAGVWLTVDVAAEMELPSWVVSVSTARTVRRAVGARGKKVFSVLLRVAMRDSMAVMAVTMEFASRGVRVGLGVGPEREMGRRGRRRVSGCMMMVVVDVGAWGLGFR